MLDKPRPGHRITGRRFHRAPPSRLGSPLAPAGPARNRTGRSDGCMLAAPVLTSRLLAAGRFPFISRSFHAGEHVVINFFDFSNRALALINTGV